jgi:hypothetical protein
VPKVFVSHSVIDHEFVQKEIVSFLQSQGVDTWFAEDEIQAAERWEHSIRRGLEACDWFVVVMSPRSAKSKWVKAEVSWAIDKREGRIIPILMQDCDNLDFHLHMPLLQHIDFRANLNEARRKLLVALRVAPGSQGSMARPPANAPATPEPYAITKKLGQAALKQRKDGSKAQTTSSLGKTVPPPVVNTAKPMMSPPAMKMSRRTWVALAAAAGALPVIGTAAYVLFKLTGRSGNTGPESSGEREKRFKH